jgi:drug/metabolite transporter (DMT)-like permease
LTALTPSPDQATPTRAIVLMLIAGFTFSGLDTAAKYLVMQGLPTPFVSWIRLSGHVLVVLVLFRAWSNKAVFTYRSLPKQVLRGFFLFGSTFFNFAALKTLQLTETISIFFFAPMVTTALAGPLLGEWAGWRRWMAIGIGFIGVLVITRPGTDTFSFGHVLSIMAMLSYCGYVIMTRMMGAAETPQSLIFYSALTPAIFLLPIVPSQMVMPESWLFIAVLASLGFFGAIGHYLLILAYRDATTGALAPYPYLQMVWMIVLGYVIFGDLPDGWTLVGASIIVGSGLYIVHRERRLRLANRSIPNAER